MESLVCCTNRKSLQWLQTSLTNDGEGEELCVKLKAGENQFKVHKGLVSFHSKFLDRMFKTSMKEKYESLATFDEISSDTMRLIVDFIYASDVEIKKKNVMNILEATSFLQIEELKGFCVKHLLATMDCSNCLSCYISGIKYMVPVLTDKAENIIKQNSLEVIAGKEFVSLEKADISAIMQCIDQTFSSSNVKALFDALVLWVESDLENRKTDFSQLVGLIKMHKLPQYFLKLLREEDLLKNIMHENYLKEVILWKSLWLSQERDEKKSHFININNREVKLFDIVCLKWRTLPQLPADGIGACALMHEQTLYVIGGDVHSNAIQALNLDDETGDWCRIGKTLVDRKAGARAICHKGLIIIAGGDTRMPRKLALDTVNRFVVDEHIRTKNHYERKNNASSFSFGSTPSNPDFYVPGHLSTPQPKSTDYLSSAETYVLKSGTQGNIDSMLHHSPMLLAKHNDSVYAIGDGINPNPSYQPLPRITTSTSIEKYEDHKWINQKEVEKFGVKAAACLNEEIFCIGKNGAKSYSCKFNEWRARQQPQIEQFEVFDIMEFENLIFLFGREETTYTLQRYNPMKDSWTTIYQEDTGFTCSLLSAT